MKKKHEAQIESNEIARREFIQKSILFVGGAIGASWLLSACGKSNSSPAASTAPNVNFTIDISKTPYTSLQTNGNYVYVNTTIVARDSVGNFVALYDVCPHAGCTIAFNSTNQFPCPCHGSIFDESGNVVQGPATSGVKKYTCTVKGTQLTVAG
jgi:cytochrome b6-f complex iron-sulfur subunit